MAIVRVLLILGVVAGLTAPVDGQRTTVPPPGGDFAAVPSGTTGDGGDSGTTAPDRGPRMFDLEISRLRTGLDMMPPPSASTRNPFRFGAARSARPAQFAARPRPGLASREHAAAEAAADRPPMQLLGVAADGSGAALVRTAVIATPRQLYLVREGEQIALRFQVVRIGTDAVELRDLVSDQTFPLALR